MNFSEQFQTRIKDMQARAEAAGLSMAELCRATGIARATPDRWLERAPQSVLKVDVLESELERRIAQKAVS